MNDVNVTLAFEDATYKVVNILPDFDISAKENIGFGNSLVRTSLTHKKNILGNFSFFATRKCCYFKFFLKLSENHHFDSKSETYLIPVYRTADLNMYTSVI